MSQPKSKQTKKSKGKGNGNKQNKIKLRIEKMIKKTSALKEKKANELELLNQQEQQLQQLLAKADELDAQTLNAEIKNIIRSFKAKRQNKNHKNGKKWKNKNDGKFNKKEFKNQKKLEKQKWKLEKAKMKQEKKAAKQKIKAERKRIKKEKADALNNARLMFLPQSVKEIGNNDKLFIHVDGYNIIGCDPVCRKGMRGRGMGKSRKRICALLQEEFLDKIKGLKLPYSVIVKLHFDGGNFKQNKKIGDIQIEFSSKAQIVDDKLVQTFSQNKFNANTNILVITTDKELTLRLFEIGVKVMKSSTFYKTYLVKQENENVNDEEKQTDDWPTPKEETETNDAVFEKFCVQKMHSIDDDTPDEVEGENDEQFTDSDFVDFTETFGEDSEEFEEVQ